MRTTRVITLATLLASLALLVSGCTLGFVGEYIDQMPDDDTLDDDDFISDDDDDDAVDDDDDGGDDDTADQYLDLVYLLDLGDDSFDVTEPAGLGDFLQSQLPQDDGAIFSATRFGGGTVDMLFGAAVVANPNGDPEDWVWEQTNHPTTAITGDWTNATFDVGPFDLTITIEDQDVFLGDAMFTGRYSTSGDSIGQSYVDVLLDTVPLSAIFGSDLCEMMTCVSCPSGCPHPGNNCVRVVAESGSCPLLVGVSMSPM